MNKNNSTTVGNIPVLKLFFKTSGWRDMTMGRFFELLRTKFFWKRTIMSLRDAVLNRRFGKLMGKYSLKLHRPFRYLYIGANDGIISDTIMKYVEKYNWQGVLVEPVPYIMKKLKNNFKHVNNQIYEQVAVSDTNGSRELYTFKTKSNQPIYVQLLHSFSKDNLLDQHPSLGIDEERDIVSIKVPTMTVEALLTKHKIKELDLLVIDTEGHDYIILRSIDFKNIQPKFIKFESLHIKPNEIHDINQNLKEYSYKIIKMRGDYFAIKP